MSIYSEINIPLLTLVNFSRLVQHLFSFLSISNSATLAFFFFFLISVIFHPVLTRKQENIQENMYKKPVYAYWGCP